MDQWHKDFRSLAPTLAQVFVNHGQADLLSFFPQRTMQPHAGQPLLGRRPRLPFRNQLLQSRSHLLPHRPRS
jgi:hypothetical protein